MKKLTGLYKKVIKVHSSSTVELLKKGEDGHGVYGEYYRISPSLGLKVLTNCTASATIQEMKEYNGWYLAKLEYAALVKARKLYPYVPKPYKVVAVRRHYRYSPGIVMQHVVKDKRRSPRDFNCARTSKTVEELLSALFGIRHNDIHDQNIIISKGKPWIIDLGMTTFGKPSPKVTKDLFTRLLMRKNVL